MTTVALVRTRPESVLDDVSDAMRRAGYREHLDPATETALKINISWQHWYPACSTAPWQLDGVTRTLLADGFAADTVFGAHNRTVVVDARVGERANKHRPVLAAHGVRNVHLYDDERWVRYEPRGRLLTLHDVFPEGVRIPERLIGTNVIHLPTMKTHVFTTITGAMKNAFGGLLFEKRHFCHATIHETLVDLLTIQQEIHKGIFAVVDGTFVGEGAGPALHGGPRARADAGGRRSGRRGRHHRPAYGPGSVRNPVPAAGARARARHCGRARDRGRGPRRRRRELAGPHRPGNVRQPRPKSSSIGVP